jgi:hypothetical protein
MPPAVLEVTLALPIGVTADADGRAVVRHALQTPRNKLQRMSTIPVTPDEAPRDQSGRRPGPARGA